MSLSWIIIGSDNGLSPVRRQAIIGTNAGILLIGPLGTNFSEILIGIQTFSFKKLRLKTGSAKWRLFCLGLSELISANLNDDSQITWISKGGGLCKHFMLGTCCYHVAKRGSFKGHGSLNINCKLRLNKVWFCVIQGRLMSRHLNSANWKRCKLSNTPELQVDYLQPSW